MSEDPDFLSVEDVLLIYEGQLSRYGGAGGLRNRTMLESAVATPQATFGGQFLHEGLFAMAAAYAFHIAENQPFVDGNKRTGVVAALVFLDLNGITLEDPHGALYQAMMDIGDKRLDKGGLASLLETLAQVG